MSDIESTVRNHHLELIDIDTDKRRNSIPEYKIIHIFDLDRLKIALEDHKQYMCQKIADEWYGHFKNFEKYSYSKL